MKRYLSILSVALVMISCTQEEPTIEQQDVVSSFTVSISGSDGTRTCLPEDSFLWTSGDELLVSTTGKVVGSGGLSEYSVYTTTADKTSSATFTSSFPIATCKSGEKYIVMYSGSVDVGKSSFVGHRFDAATGYDYIFASIPSKQTYSADGLAPYTMPMYAVTESLDDVKLTSLGTIVRLKLYGSEGEKIRNIKLTSGNGYYISGTYALGTTASSAGGVSYDNDAYTVFDEDDCYFGMWNEASTTSNWGSLDVTLDCGEEGVTLSSDPNNPTVFNIVIAHRYGVYPEVSASILKVGDSNYSNPQRINLPTDWKHNKIYAVSTTSISSYY